MWLLLHRQIGQFASITVILYNINIMLGKTKSERTIKKAQMKKQRKIFAQRTKTLFENKYRYSLKFEEMHVFEDGKAYINVDLTKVDSPFSVYSYDNRLNDEIYAYIEQETQFLRVDIPVVINFDDGGKYDDSMKEKIRKAVTRHYSLCYEDQKLDLRKSRLFGLFSFIFGGLVLSLYIFLGTFFDIPNFDFFGEILTIIAWVFIWEAVDRFFLSGNEQKLDLVNASQLALSEVQFGKPVIKKL